MGFKKQICFINKDGYKIYFENMVEARTALNRYGVFLTNSNKEFNKSISTEKKPTHLLYVYQNESLIDCEFNYNTEYHCEWSTDKDEMLLIETKSNTVIKNINMRENINKILENRDK